MDAHVGQHKAMLLFLESLGTTELLLILVVALMIFGPRKLPELARSLGRSLNQFKQASDDFKRTWEREVELEGDERRASFERALLPEIKPEHFPATERTGVESDEPPAEAATTIARGSRPASVFVPTEPGADAATSAPEPSRKSDWL